MLTRESFSSGESDVLKQDRLDLPDEDESVNHGRPPRWAPTAGESLWARPTSFNFGSTSNRASLQALAGLTARNKKIFEPENTDDGTQTLVFDGQLAKLSSKRQWQDRCFVLNLDEQVGSPSLVYYPNRRKVKSRVKKVFQSGQASLLCKVERKQNQIHLTADDGKVYALKTKTQKEALRWHNGLSRLCAMQLPQLEAKRRAAREKVARATEAQRGDKSGAKGGGGGVRGMRAAPPKMQKRKQSLASFLSRMPGAAAAAPPAVSRGCSASPAETKDSLSKAVDSSAEAVASNHKSGSWGPGGGAQIVASSHKSVGLSRFLAKVPANTSANPNASPSASVSSSAADAGPQPAATTVTAHAPLGLGVVLAPQRIAATYPAPTTAESNPAPAPANASRGSKLAQFTARTPSGASPAPAPAPSKLSQFLQKSPLVNPISVPAPAPVPAPTPAPAPAPAPSVTASTSTGSTRQLSNSKLGAFLQSMTASVSSTSASAP